MSIDCLATVWHGEARVDLREALTELGKHVHIAAQHAYSVSAGSSGHGKGRSLCQRRICSMTLHTHLH